MAVKPEKSDNASQPNPWLGEVKLSWTAASGSPWLVTTHWAQVDGQAAIVGLDVRSFADIDADGTSIREPVGDDLAEVTQAVLRGLRISQIREDARHQILRNVEHFELLSSLDAASVPIGADPDEWKADHEQVWAADAAWAVDRRTALTAKGERRQRRPPATEALLRRVAALDEEAKRLGDKASAKYVYERLVAAGEVQSHHESSGRAQVRKWIQRARELPPTTERD